MDPETTTEPVPEPSTIQTIVFDMEEDERNEHLGHLMEYEQVYKAAWRMRYGEVYSMVQWCRAQGKGISAKWEVKKIAGKIPLHYAAILSVIILILGIQREWPITWVLSATGVMFLLFFFMAWRFSEYEYDKQGICHICGEPWEGNFKHSLEYYNHRNKRVKVSNAGYCEQCGHNKHRFNLWNAALSQLWGMILENPTKKPTILRRIGYIFFWMWPFYFREKFVDPRPVGQGSVYERGEKHNPQDQAAENLIDNTVLFLFMAAQNLQKMRSKRF